MYPMSFPRLWTHNKRLTFLLIKNGSRLTQSLLTWYVSPIHFNVEVCSENIHLLLDFFRNIKFVKGDLAQCLFKMNSKINEFALNLLSLQDLQLQAIELLFKNDFNFDTLIVIFFILSTNYNSYYICDL